MKKVLVTILAITMVALGTIFVIGQSTETDTQIGKKHEKHGKFGKRGKYGKRGKRGNGMGRMFRQLDLTDDQKTQLKEIRKASFTNTKALRQQIRENRQQLNQATENGYFDEAPVTAIAQQMGQLHAQMIVEKQKVKAQMFNVLTAEQKAKAAEMKADFKKKMQERKAKWAAKKAEREAQ